MTLQTGRRLHLAFLVLCLPIAALGAILPVNEYAAIGAAGAVDCDGPFSALTFAAPAFVIYASNAATLFWIRAREPRWHIGMSVFCLIVSLCVLPNLITALVADRHNAAEASCH